MATTSSDPGTAFTTDPSALVVGGEEVAPGIGPWRLALRRLRRNKVALFFGGLFLLIVVLCLLAPVYANHVAHIGLAEEHIDKPINIGGKSTFMSPIGIPIGPTWHSQYLLGADSNGRDVAVRSCMAGATRSRSGRSRPSSR